MPNSHSEKRVALLFYILTIYILLQFVWWAYLLIDLNRQMFSGQGSEVVNLKIWMIIGEGSVFLLFFFAGVYIMQRTIRKEIALVRQQRNFLLSITHELKTPLASIKLGLQTLRKRTGLSPDERKPFEETAIINTERLHSLIDNVLLATRIESGQRPLQIEPENISNLTERIAINTAKSIGKLDQLKLNIEAGLVAPVDSNAYESILGNLLENGFKYSDKTKVSVELQRQENQIILSVVDLGPGIPASERKKIFDKFYRMGNEETRSKKGTGLGLFIVKELVELHRGKVTVHPNFEGGSIFKVELPG